MYPGIIKIILGPISFFLLRKEKEEGKNSCSKLVLELPSIVSFVVTAFCNWFGQRFICIVLFHYFMYNIIFGWQLINGILFICVL